MAQLQVMGIVPLHGPQAVAGRLKHFVANWRRITTDRWVLETVNGYAIDLHSTPRQAGPPREPHLDMEAEAMLASELNKLLDKGAVRRVEESRAGFVSTMFLVPKKDGGQRPVVNLKALNDFVGQSISRWRAFTLSEICSSKATGTPRST